MKLTYSKSEPYKSGWKGWADWIDVFLDGKQIGMLFTEGQDHRKFLEYEFTDRLSNRRESERSGYQLHVREYGLKVAKAKLQQELQAMVATVGERP